MIKYKISKFVILFISLVFLIFNSDIFAEENFKNTVENNKELVKKSESKEELMNMHYYKTPHTKVTNEFHIFTAPFLKEIDLIDQIEENMAWDKDIHYSKSPDDKVHVSVGFVKMKRAFCGAMLKVRLFK